MTAPSTRPLVPVPATGGYRIDPSRSGVTFATRHLFGLGAVRGTFALREGSIGVTEPTEQSWARATVAVASVDTGHPGRDRSIRSDRLLGTGTHPEITFVSDGLSCADGRWSLTGTLRVRDVPAPVRLLVDRITASGPDLHVRAVARVDRHAFGITRYRGVAARHLDVRLDVVATRMRVTGS